MSGITALQNEYPALHEAVAKASTEQRRRIVQGVSLIALRRTDVAGPLRSAISEAIRDGAPLGTEMTARLQQMQEAADSYYLDELDALELDEDQSVPGKRKPLTAEAEKARVRARALWAILEGAKNGGNVSDVIYESLCTAPAGQEGTDAAHREILQEIGEILGMPRLAQERRR